MGTVQIIRNGLTHGVSITISDDNNVPLASITVTSEQWETLVESVG